MLATIDIGSLTARLLIGEVHQGQVLPHLYRRAITGLGAGLHQNRGLSPEAREQTLAALDAFSGELKRWQTEGIWVFGTEALRKAANAADFTAEIGRRCGLEVNVVDGEREALLTARGVLAGLQPVPDCCLIVDVGGGSSEFVLVDMGKVLWRISLPLGVVRLSAAPVVRRQELINHWLLETKRSLHSAGLLQRALGEDCVLAGTAGTITTLAAIELQLTRYDGRLVNNLCLSRMTIAKLYGQLCDHPPSALRGLAGLEPGREEFIGCGAAIVQMLLEVFDKPLIKVSDFGLLEGAMLELSEGHAH